MLLFHYQKSGGLATNIYSTNLREKKKKDSSMSKNYPTLGEGLDIAEILERISAKVDVFSET